MKEKIVNMPQGNKLTDQELEALTKDPQVAQFLQAIAERAVKPQGMSNVEMFMAEVRAAYEPEEWDEAMSWANRVFEKLIHTPPKGPPVVIFCKIVSTPKTRKLGLSTSPNGFTNIHSLNVDRLVMYYIEIILKEGLTDKEKIWAMIKYSRSNPHGGTAAAGALHPEWDHLVGKDSKGEEKLELWIHEYS